MPDNFTRQREKEPLGVKGLSKAHTSTHIFQNAFCENWGLGGLAPHISVSKIVLVRYKNIQFHDLRKVR